MRLSADSYTGKPAPASFRHLTGLLAVLVFLILLSPPKVVAATDISGHTDIGDGKTLLNGAQILGKSIEGNTRDLEIHSPQGTMDYQSKQNALSGSVLYGYGLAGNLDYQNTRVEAHEKTVNVESGHRDAVRGVQESDNSRIQALTSSIKQNDAQANKGQDKTGGVSGFYAGDDGYRIHNTGTTVLGGLITSTAKAEAEGKNSFSTDRLVREDIHNYSNYKGRSIALGLSTVLGGKTLGQEQDERFINVGDSGVGKTFGIGHDQRSQEGVTIGSVNTANLTIHDDAGQRLLTGESAAEAAKNANRGITLEHVKERNGTTSVSFDADKVTRDITSTAQVMQGFDGTTQGIKHDLRKQADAYRARGDEETAAKLDKVAIGVDMLKGGLTPTDSALGTIANTAAPLVSYQIGQYAKAHGSEGSAGHIAAHAALAALTSAANGGSGTDIATSAGTAAAAEIGAPLVAKGFYGTSDSSKLTAEQKETISNILGLAAAGAGAAVGNSATAYNAGKTAQNAVENNRQMDFLEFAWIDSNAKKFAQQEGITEDEAKARLTQQAAREIDGMSALMLADKYDEQASLFLERQGKTEAEYQKYLEGVDVPTITPDGKITFAQDSVETFINEDGEKQKLFTKVGDDYWMPDKNALQATIFNDTHNQFVERYLTSGMTRDYKESAITYAGEKTMVFKDAIDKGARWVYNNKAEAAKKTSDWMGKTINTGFQNVTSVEGWGNIAQGAKDYGAGILDRVENATTNAYITIASRLPFKSFAKETMNQLNTIYGRDMRVPMAELTSIQGAISGMEVWPIGKGATLGYKAAVPAVEKAIKSTAPVVKKAVSTAEEKIVSARKNFPEIITRYHFGDQLKYYNWVDKNIIINQRGKGRAILTGDVDHLGNPIAQRINPNGKPGNFYALTTAGEQIPANKPYRLKRNSGSGSDRPTPLQSELDVERDFGNRGVPVETQVSFMNGQRVPYGTPGSTRPDLCIGNSCSIEVKNYDITNNKDSLVDNVVNQAIYRDKHIPAGMKQIVIIDIRGQNVDLVTKGKIQSEIYTKTNGIIDFSNVIFKDK